MYNLTYQNREAYTDFLKEWDWEWFATLTFRYDTNEDMVNRLRLKWTRDLCTDEGIQVAYFYSTVNVSGHPHIHMLMIGKNKNNKILFDVDPQKWESIWPFLARIETPKSNETVARYFTENLAQLGSDYDTYNQHLLKKTLNANRLHYRLISCS